MTSALVFDVCGTQCDQIGRFFKLLGKVAQKFCYLFGLFFIIQLSCKKYLATFWAISVKIGQLFITSSGHTGHS